MPEKQHQNGKSRFDEEFIASLTEAVKSNNAPWQRAWKTGELIPPYNAMKGNIYAGRNALSLAVQALKRGYTDPRWATFKQIQEMGGMVRAGEQSTGILFFGQVTREDEKTGEEKTYPVARSYRVFNIEQTNLPKLTREELRAVEPDLAAFAELLEHHSPVFVHGEPAYNQYYDRISMPDKAEFVDDASYYTTVLHEMGHWTGHKSRLDRLPEEILFGSPEYAHEELVAELASYMLSLEYGLPFEPNQSEAYLRSWAEGAEEEIGAALRRGFEDALTAKNYLDAPIRDRTIEIDRAVGITVIPAKEMLRLTIPTKPERDEAKEKGARWNKSEKCWQIPADSYLGDFIQWLPTNSVGAHELTLADFRAHATVSQTITDNTGRNDPLTWTVKFGNATYFKAAATAEEAVERAHQSAVASALYANTPRGREEYISRTGDMSPRFPPRAVLYEYQDLLAQYPDAAPLVASIPTQSGKAPRTTPVQDELSVAAAMDILGGKSAAQVVETKAAEAASTAKAVKAAQKTSTPTAKGTATRKSAMPASAVQRPTQERSTSEHFRTIFTGDYSEEQVIDDMMAQERTYLAVSMDERREAKSRGAKWDAENQCWYTDNLKMHPELARYQRRPADFMAQGGKTLDDFREALRSLGMVTERWSETPNVWHRLPVEGRGPHDKAGSYIIYHNADGTIGAFARNQASGEELRWSDRSGKESRIPQEVQRAADLNSAISRRVNEAARDYVAQLRAEDALKAYKTLEDVRGDEPYFSRKQMAYTHGLKRLDDGTLVVPLINGQRVGDFADIPRSEKWFGLVSMQTIAPDGSKMLMKQAQKSGAYFPIGTDVARLMPTHLILAEGVATAEAAYQIMSKGARSARVLAVAGIDAGNLTHVADTLQKMYPEAEKILAVDNDIATEQKIGKNPGRAAAAAVAEKYPEYRLVIPEAIADKNTDWNDVLLAKGTNSCILDFFSQLGIGPAKKPEIPVAEAQAQLLPVLQGLAPRDIGKTVWEVTQGNPDKLAQVQRELHAQGYRFDEKRLHGVLNTPVAMKDAFAKAVSPLPEKAVAPMPKKEVVR